MTNPWKIIYEVKVKFMTLSVVPKSSASVFRAGK